jgi:hypothetical protein
MKKDPIKYALPIVFITFQTKAITGIVEETWGYKFTFSLKSFSKLFQSNKYYTYTKGFDAAGNPVTDQVQIRLTTAPNPNDLVWENLGVEFMAALPRRIVTFLATFLLLGISFGAVVGLKVLQYNMNKNQPKDTKALSVSSLKFRVVSVIITLIIMIINRALSMGIRTLTLTEKQTTKTDFFQSLTIKVVIVVCAHQSQFLNTNLIIVLIHMIIFSPDAAIYAKGALLSDAWFILISQATLTPLLTFFDLSFMWTKYKVAGLLTKIQNNQVKTMTQEEAHKQLEYSDFDPSLAYTAFANVVLTMFFFQPILPICGATGLFALIMLYYAYKKKLLRDSKRPVMVTDNIAEVTLYLLNLGPFVNGVGRSDRRCPTSSSTRCSEIASTPSHGSCSSSGW